MKLANQTSPERTPPQPPPAAPRHFHLGGTEENYGTYRSLEEAEAAVAEQATRWIARYGADAVHSEQGYVAVWRRGVRIDYRTAFACANPYCAPDAAPTGTRGRLRPVA